MARSSKDYAAVAPKRQVKSTPVAKKEPAKKPTKASRPARKLIRNVAKKMASDAAEKNTFSPYQLGQVYNKGMSMGVSERKMGNAIIKGVKQGNKAKAAKKKTS